MLRLVDYVRTLYQDTQKPIVGICFGHQIIARALGTPVQRSTIGWEVSVDEINMTAEGKKLFGVEKLVSWLPPPLSYRREHGIFHLSCQQPHPYPPVHTHNLFGSHICSFPLGTPPPAGTTSDAS